MIIWLVLAVLFSASDLWAATYWVSTTGSDSNTCTNSATPPATSAGYKRNIGVNSSSGLGCLSSGDTLIIRSGTYSESIYGIGSPQVQIPSGTAGAPTTIKPYTGETVTMRPPNSSHEDVIWTNRSYIVIGDQSRAASLPKNLILDATN